MKKEDLILRDGEGKIYRGLPLFIDGKFADLNVDITSGDEEKVHKFWVINGAWEGVVNYEKKEIEVRDSYGKLRTTLPFEKSVRTITDEKFEKKNKRGKCK